jgi:hypothetical protein
VLATDSAHTGEVRQDAQGLLHDFMGLFPFDVSDETDTTGFIFELGVVMSSIFGNIINFILQPFGENILSFDTN